MTAACAACGTMVLISSASAQTNPVLTFDFRVDGTGAKQATVAKIGDAVVLDLFATVRGNDADVTNDGFSSSSGAFKSGVGGLLGDIVGLTPPAPFNGAGMNLGTQLDIDGDGDLDLGNNASSVQVYYMRTNNVAYNTSPPGEFFIGQVRFNVTSLAAASTTISWIPRSYSNFTGNYGSYLYIDGKPLSLRNDDARVHWADPIIINAQPAIPPGTVTYISGTINTHLTVSGNVAPAAGSTVTLTQGIDVTASGNFDTRGPGGYGPHLIQINDTTSGNAGGQLFVGNMTIGNGSFTHSDGFTTVGTNLTAGGAGTDATLNIAGGQFTGASAVTIGAGGNASVSQTGGVAVFPNLHLGAAAGGSASYSLSDGELDMSTPIVGVAGNAVFSQSGGKAFSANRMTIADQAGSVASFQLSGGTFSAPFINVGHNGAGSGLQTGGILDAGVDVGTRPNAQSDGYNPNVATYTFNAGIIKGPIRIGENNGRLTQNGGVLDNYVNYGAITVDTAGTTAEYQMHGGSINTNFIYVGCASRSFYDSNGKGLFAQSGGTTTTDYLYMGSLGIYNLSGGSLKVNKELAIRGTVDFANSSASLTIGAKSFADFTKAKLLNTGNAYVTGEANSLMNFAAGYDPLTQIGHFSTAGLVHIAGQPLTIPSAFVLHGTGSIEGDVTNTGTVSPGNSPGELDIVGNYSQLPAGILEIELAGNTTDLFDILTASGTADLHGQLSVALLDDYLPKHSDQFNFLTASSLTGAFANAANGIDFPGGHFDVIYSPTSVTLANFVATPEPGLGMALVVLPLLTRRRRRC